MLASPELRAALHTVMQRGASTDLADNDFNSLAQRVFEHQFELNQPYRKFCQRRGRTPALVNDWTEIPAVPTAAFKEVALVAGDARDARLAFKTSGTTRGAERRGIHYLLDPSLYEASVLPTFREFVLRDATRMRMLSLIPSATDQPESSLSYMTSVVMRELSSAHSAYVVSARAGLQVADLKHALEQSIDRNEPVCLLGTSLAFAHYLDRARAPLALPVGSRLMDTGGFKGELRSHEPTELRTSYREAFGLPMESCINEYGMTELCSQCYDAEFAPDRTTKRGPPWLRTRVVDPDTLASVRRGEIGILQHFDLANLDSVAAVLTEDLGFETDGGFVLLGRVPNAMPRGCSIAMDILLSDAKAE